MITTKRRTRPIGRNLVIEVVLPESQIVLTDGAIAGIDDKDFVVTDVGSECTRGIKVGDIVQPADGFRGLATTDGRKLHFVCSETDIEAIIDLLPGEAD
jgi:hypothetical protein